MDRMKELNRRRSFLNHTRKVGSLTLLSRILMLGVAGLPLKAQQHRPPPLSQSSKSVPARSGVWKSQTTGKEYRVRVERDSFHAEWVNIPQDSAREGAYIRTACRRQGSKWIGKCHIFLPCAVGHGPIVNRCHLDMGFVIDQISEGRISGRIEDPDLTQFDCKSCNVPKTVWKDFVWVPKR